MRVVKVRSDVLVIGGGGAGLMAAIRAREEGADVVLVSKSRAGRGNNTYISRGVLSAAMNHPVLKDEPAIHFRDSLLSGCFINQQEILQRVVQEAPKQIAYLEKCGIQLQWRDQNRVALPAPGHSLPRGLCSQSDNGSGYAIPLRRYALKIGVRLIENAMVTRLFENHSRFSGAVGLSLQGGAMTFEARSCILATGGFGQIYLKTNNAPGTTGDGQSLAYELGIPLKDMEFVQYYPTALGHLGRSIVLFERGAVLKNSLGQNIPAKHGLNNPSSLTRDRLARAIFNEIRDGFDVRGGIIMDVSKTPQENRMRLQNRSPGHWASAQTEFIVSPTAHFCMGGVVTNESGETEIAGVFAAGEICGGVHGANRLGGNALAEVFVMGGIVGIGAAEFAHRIKTPESSPEESEFELSQLSCLGRRGSRQTGVLRDLRRSLKELIWKKAGIVRDGLSLKESLEGIKQIRTALSDLQIENEREKVRALEIQNMLRMGEMVCRAALMRTESRGAHFRSDYPERDDVNWLSNITIRKTAAGMKLEPVPAPPLPTLGSSS